MLVNEPGKVSCTKVYSTAQISPINKYKQIAPKILLPSISPVNNTCLAVRRAFEQRDRWVNFIEVNKLNTILSKATANGATVIYQPKNRGLAIIADPNGALLGLTQQESE